VQIFFSFSADDNRANGIPSAWHAQLMQALERNGTPIAHVYFWENIEPGTQWERNQSLYLKAADLVIPFVTYRYLNAAETDPRFRELGQAIEQFRNEETDIMPVPVADPMAEALGGQAKIHWEALETANTLLMGCTDKSGRVISCLDDLPEVDRQTIPGPALARLVEYCHNQFQWIAGGRQGVRPLLKDQEGMRALLSRRQVHQTSPLAECLVRRAGSMPITLPQTVQAWPGTVDETDLVFLACLDELLFFLQTCPSDDATDQWLRSRLPSSRGG